MKREKADPAGDVDRVLVWVIAPGDQMGNIVDRNDPVEERQDDKDRTPRAK